ncbi:MAG: radical SAM protein [archaeon]
MNKKILLFEPGTKLTKFPPLGLISLAAVLRENKFEAFVKDYSGREIDEKTIEQDIYKSQADFIGVRVLTGPNIIRALKISKIANKLGKRVIWGGPHPTVLPEQTLKNSNINAVVIGEGEYSLINLLNYMNGKKVDLFGCGIKKNNKIIITKPSKKFVDLDKLPVPAWDLLENINQYFPDKNNNLLPISTTRGCAFKCGFCHNSNKNVKGYLGCYRIADPKKAIEEYKIVQGLVKNRIDILDLGEDLHLVSETYTKKFCKTMKDSGLKLKWYTSSRYHTLNKNIIDMISSTNCIRILLGVESGSERIQKMNNKIIELDRAVQIAKMLIRKKIFLTNAYIFGHPTETPEELRKTIHFINKIPADENLIQLYRPMPGTPYFDLCLKQGKVKVPNRLEDWAGFGVLGYDVNVSEVPSSALFSLFYKVNAKEQTKYWFNQQRFYLRNNMHQNFLNNFVNNRFTFKLKEYLESKK